MKFGVRRVQCEVWSVECEDFASSLAEKKTACRGKDTVGTGCLRTIGHLFLGNFRRRLARVLVYVVTTHSYIVMDVMCNTVGDHSALVC